MAVIKFTGLVTDIVGKLGGSVLQGGLYGTILRNNAYGKRKQTQAAYLSRANFAWLSNYGSHLTIANKADKETSGALITRPTKGGPATPYNWWNFNQAFNGKLKAIGFAPIAGGWTAPALTEILNLTVVHTGGTTYWRLENDNVIGADERVIIRVGGKVLESSGYKRSTLRQVKIGAGSTDRWDVEAADVALLFGGGSFTVVRWFSIQVVDSLTGFFSPEQTFQFVP